MKLNELLKNVKPICIIGSDDIDITGVNIDSRKIETGHLFVAIKGTQTDGHKFIPKALELGASAVLCRWSHLCAGRIYGKCRRSCSHRFLWRAI